MTLSQEALERLGKTTEPLSNAPVKFPRDIYAFYGERLLEDHLAEKFQPGTSRPLPVLVPTPADQAPASLAQANVCCISVAESDKIRPPEKPVGILGAGVGGLYTAMMLQDLGIPFEILEATGRTGGRLFTYKFYNGNAHDYFDVGAMRYPDADKNPSMRRLWKLFESRQLNPDGAAPGDRLTDKLIPYIFTSDETFRFYNGVRVKQTEASTFRFQETGVSPEVLKIGGDKFLEKEVLDYFVPELLEDLHTPGRHKGWDRLMEFDNYSTRAYMTLHKKIDTVTVDWVETVTYGTGWFDRALTELVCEYIAFSEFLGDKATYHCLDGGSRVLPDFMTKYINQTCPNALQLGKRVTEISYDGKPRVLTPSTPVRVRVEGEANAREYGHVVSTLPLPVLRSLGIDDAGLDVMQSNALRQLQYGPSEKIGIKFRTQWWRTGTDLDGKPLNIVGGQSFSDRVCRTVVYPSFGVPGNPPESTVLIASYSWTEDANRLGSMISAGDGCKMQIKELALRDMAKIHNVSYDFLNEQYEDHFGWDWTHDPLTQGAFAFFGPGDFSTIYKSLTRPAAGGRLHFAGEALSVRHAWVVGALDSAWRAVKEILWLSYPHLICKFECNWGNNEEWIIPDTLKEKIQLPEQPQRDTTAEQDKHQVDRDLILLQIAGHLSNDFPIGRLPADPQTST